MINGRELIEVGQSVQVDDPDSEWHGRVGTVKVVTSSSILVRMPVAHLTGIAIFFHRRKLKWPET